MDYAYVLKQDEYDHYMSVCGSEEKIVEYLNETLRLNHIITSIIVRK